jgi:choice-of-anchor B domain-containing protein
MLRRALLVFWMAQAAAQTPCTGGFAGNYACSNLDLQSLVTFSQMGGNSNTEGSSCWGWTDPLTGREYALMGCSTHLAFVDITDPVNPIYRGKMNGTGNSTSSWREVKTYGNYCYVTSEAAGHGLQIFDLTRLRNPTGPLPLAPDALYTGFGNCHTLIINEETGYLYAMGSNTFGGGPHILDLSNPVAPVLAGGYNAQGYTHDGQVVTYHGPDAEHFGKEIFIGANQNRVVIVDMTNKAAPQLLSTFMYPNTAYTHQGWFTEDHRYWLLGDEIDEIDFGFNSKTLILDFADLDNPVLVANYFGPTAAVDHNGFVLGDEFFLSNYTAGLRILSTEQVGAGTLTEVGYFDTYPENNNAVFNGAWSNYPYFPSGSIIISDIDRGLFVVRKSGPLSTNDLTKTNFTLAPNPTSTEVLISSPVAIETIEVADMLGKKVLSVKTGGLNEHTLNVDALSPGVYFVTLNQSQVNKLIVR